MTPPAGYTFRPGRLYRLLCVVNGPTYLEDVEAVLQAMGFGPIASSDPVAWERERPPDWPDEGPLPAIAANEAFVRITAGAGALPYPGVQLARDVPIPDARTGAVTAHLTIARAWDYGQAPPVAAVVGAAAPPPPRKSGGNGVALVAAGGLAVVGLWHHIAERRRLKREETRLHSAEAKAEREAVAGEVNRLIRAGYSAPQAREQARAELEQVELLTDEEIVILAASTER